jgi:hypothetical protein
MSNVLRTNIIPREHLQVYLACTYLRLESTSTHRGRDLKLGDVELYNFDHAVVTRDSTFFVWILLFPSPSIASRFQATPHYPGTRNTRCQIPSIWPIIVITTIRPISLISKLRLPNVCYIPILQHYIRSWSPTFFFSLFCTNPDLIAGMQPLADQLKVIGTLGFTADIHDLGL